MSQLALSSCTKRRKVSHWPSRVWTPIQTSDFSRPTFLVEINPPPATKHKIEQIQQQPILKFLTETYVNSINRKPPKTSSKASMNRTAQRQICKNERVSDWFLHWHPPEEKGKGKVESPNPNQAGKEVKTNDDATALRKGDPPLKPKNTKQNDPKLWEGGGGINKAKANKLGMSP